MTTPDPLAGELAAIKDRWAKVEYVGLKDDVVPEPGPQPRWLDDVPALAAAVEAVLAPHRPGRIVIMGSLCAAHEAHRHFSITGTEAQAVRDCPECAGEPFVICTGCAGATAFTGCPVRKTVAAALMGEGKPDGA